MRHKGFGLPIQFLALALVASGSIECFLENPLATCELCWVTTSGGFTTMSECPSGVVITWTHAPPDNLLEGDTWSVSYQIYVNQTQLPIVKNVKEIPHTNIKSCQASVGACTPFAVDPALSMETSPQSLNLGPNSTEEVHTAISLKAGSHMIIVHARFYVPDSDVVNYTVSCNGMCLKTYDVAIGTARTVEKATDPFAFTFAYTMAGGLGFILLAIAGMIVYAVYVRRISIEEIIASMFSASVVVFYSVVISFASQITFTLTVSLVVLPDASLGVLIPVTAVILVTSWIACIYSIYHHYKAFKMLHQKVEKEEKFFKNAFNSFYQKRKSRDRAIPKLSKQQLRRRSIRMSSSKIGKEVLTQYHKTESKFEAVYVDLVSLVFQAIPTALLQAAILYMADDAVQIITIVSFTISSVIIGTKLGKISGISKAMRERNKHLRHLMNLDKGLGALAEDSKPIKIKSKPIQSNSPDTFHFQRIPQISKTHNQIQLSHSLSDQGLSNSPLRLGSPLRAHMKPKLLKIKIRGQARLRNGSVADKDSGGARGLKLCQSMNHDNIRSPDASFLVQGLDRKGLPSPELLVEGPKLWEKKNIKNSAKGDQAARNVRSISQESEFQRESRLH